MAATDLSFIPPLDDPDTFLILESAEAEQHLENNDIPVLVDFYSPSCAPCMKMAPDCDQIALFLYILLPFSVQGPFDLCGQKR